MATQSKKQWKADKQLAKSMSALAVSTQGLVRSIEKSTKPIWQSKIIWAATLMVALQGYFAYTQGVGKEEIVGTIFAAAVAALRIVTTKTLTTKAKKEGK